MSGRQPYAYSLHTFFTCIYKSLQTINYRKVKQTSEKNQVVHVRTISWYAMFSEITPFRKIPGGMLFSENGGVSFHPNNTRIHNTCYTYVLLNIQHTVQTYKMCFYCVVQFCIMLVLRVTDTHYGKVRYTRTQHIPMTIRVAVGCW